ncbi:MAG: response regulator [Comamonadaceae bacterium]|nr:response regulator [Comamonadaceae bacterium]RRD56237.1 DNA-binding response regulator [Comamonadaceae bacterium OH2545_COT-014]
MPRPDDALVFLIDDDASVREAMAWLLRSRRLVSEGFDSAAAFERLLGPPPAAGEEAEPPAHPACILLDVRMPGDSGLALFERLLARGVAHAWPVIFLTGHADVPTAVATVKRGAFDFCEKPFSDNALVDRVEQALRVSQARVAALHERRAVQARVQELTEREQDVMRCMARGLPNKLTADELGISVRTVEVHRARVFEKMDVKSAVELANLLQKI